MKKPTKKKRVLSPVRWNPLSHHQDHRRDCANCGAPMTSSDVNDYGSLCRRCYMLEYYGRED